MASIYVQPHLTSEWLHLHSNSITSSRRLEKAAVYVSLSVRRLTMYWPNSVNSHGNVRRRSWTRCSYLLNVLWLLLHESRSVENGHASAGGLRGPHVRSRCIVIANVSILIFAVGLIRGADIWDHLLLEQLVRCLRSHDGMNSQLVFPSRNPFERLSNDNSRAADMSIIDDPFDIILHWLNILFVNLVDLRIVLSDRSAIFEDQLCCLEPRIKRWFANTWHRSRHFDHIRLTFPYFTAS